MTDTLPDLWPDSIRTTVLSPIAILRLQAAKLKERTKGLLEAEVITSDGGMENGSAFAIHRFEVVANNPVRTRHQMLTATHHKKLLYPATVESGYLPKDLNYMEMGILPIGPPMPPFRKFGYLPIEAPNSTQDLQKYSALNPDEFVYLLGVILKSDGAVSALLSLIATINELESSPT